MFKLSSSVFLSGLLLFTFSSEAFAAPVEPTSAPSESLTSESKLPAPFDPSPTAGANEPPVRMSGPEESARPSWASRATKDGTVMLGLTTLSLIVPFKMAVNAGWKVHPEWNFEVGYLTGSISAGVSGFNVGTFSEKSLQAAGRYFGSWNSFNLLVGISKDSGNARLGSDLINGVSGVGSYDVVEFESLGLLLGLGNRWQWNNGFTVAVDWLSVSVPVSVTKSESFYFKSNASAAEKAEARDILDSVAKLPRVALGNVYLGYSF